MKKKFLYGTMALGLLFTACSSDEDLVGNGNLPLDAEQTFYVSLKISGDANNTRSSESNGAPNNDDTDFKVGSPTENQVNDAYFVFYDDNGNVVGDVVSVELPEADETPNGNAVEKSYKSVVAVSVRKGEKKPSQVICYINPIQSGSLNVNLNTIQTVSRSDFSSGSGDNQYFAMSNSVYYSKEESASTPVIATNIPSEQLYDSESKAEAALAENKCVDIYVERYASKLSFNATTATSEPYKTATRVYSVDEHGKISYSATPVTLTFTPQYWAVNAEANRTYVIKSFRQESEDGILLGNDYTYANLNKIINVNGTGVLGTEYYWDWNNPDYHRSYWSMSPAYYTSKYPEVSSDVMGEDAFLVNQKYISYNELATKGYSATNTAAQYFRETTVGSKALNSSNPAAAVASVIYVGQYGVTINEDKVADNPGFYTYLSGPVEGVEDDRPYVYFENENNGSSKVAGGESMLKRFLVQATCFYKAVTIDGETSYVRLTIANGLNTLVNALEVTEISDEVKTAYDGNSDTKLKLQANTRTLQLKSADYADGIYILTGNGYQQVVADGTTTGNNQITLTEANLAIMRQVGYAYYYTTGLAYFNIPVKHLGWYRTGNEQKNADKIEWSKVRVGDFGMVRNHSYSINVSEINGLASGIGGKDIPIVPPATKDDYFVAYSVKILKWAVVPTQSVKL